MNGLLDEGVRCRKSYDEATTDYRAVEIILEMQECLDSSRCYHTCE